MVACSDQVSDARGWRALSQGDHHEGEISRDLGLPRSQKLTTTVRLTRNYDYYLELFPLLLLLLFQTRHHQPGRLSFSKGSRTVAGILHPLLGGE